MSKENEADFLVLFFEKNRCGGALAVSEIHSALQERLGHRIVLATAYNLLHRHGWRKPTPDKRTVAAGPSEYSGRAASVPSETTGVKS